MVEKDEKVEVSDKEVAAIETEITEKAKAERAQVEAEVTEKVKAEIVAKQEREKAVADKAAVDKQLAEKDEELTKLRAANDAQIASEVQKRFAEEETRRKAIVNPLNPLQKGEEKPFKAEALTPEELATVERDSEKAFSEKYKLPPV